MTAIFAVGDIHGEEEKLVKLLRYWKHDQELLVLTGDLVDRGADSYGVIQLAMKLQKEYGAVIIGGNHDSMLINWLDDPNGELEMYYPQGGRETIHSFFDQNITFRYQPEYIADLMKKQYPEEIDFLRGLPDYFEQGEHVFVHAGVNLDYRDWRNTCSNDFRWIRQPFHYGVNETGKIFVFGHTVTSYLNQDETRNIWISPCKTKIGIDGGAVFGGYLHGLRIKDEHQYEVLSVNRDLVMHLQKLSLNPSLLVK